MAYNDNQTLTYVDKIQQVMLKFSDFMEQWDVLYAEYTRNGLSSTITDDLLSGSNYAGTTASDVTTAVSAAENIDAAIKALTNYEAWLQQMQVLAKNR